MSIKQKMLAASFPAIFCIILAPVHAQQIMKVRDTIHLSGEGRFDYVTVAHNKLYASHNNKINIVDLPTGKEIESINGLSGVHGIAIDKQNGKGYISNGTSNNITVFNLKTNLVKTTIATEKNPDAIIYEPYTQSIIVGNGKSRSITIIDAKTDIITHTIDINGKPEAIVSNNTGTLFVNIEDKSEIAVISLKNFIIEKRISLLPEGSEPAGLAIDRKNNLLFAGCRNKKLIVVNYKNSKIESTYPIGGYCDGIAYNSNTKEIFSSNGDGTLTLLHQTTPTRLDVRTITTLQGAKTIAFDQENNTIYLPTADFSSTEKDANGRAVVLPNSFKILVVK